MRRLSKKTKNQKRTHTWEGGRDAEGQKRRQQSSESQRIIVGNQMVQHNTPTTGTSQQASELVHTWVNESKDKKKQKTKTKTKKKENQSVVTGRRRRRRRRKRKEAASNRSRAVIGATAVNKQTITQANKRPTKTIAQ
jgi:hypothetical protein